MKPKRHIELQKKICMDLGADLDSELCQQVGNFMEAYPECKVYYDTMKRSVKLYRVIEDDCDLPDQVSERLFQVLDLEKLKKDV